MSDAPWWGFVYIGILALFGVLGFIVTVHAVYRHLWPGKGSGED